MFSSDSTFTTFREDVRAVAASSGLQVTADDLRGLLSAWAVHTRRFPDLVAAHRAALDAIDAHRTVITEPQWIETVVLYARAQIEGRWDTAGLAGDGTNMEVSIQRLTSWLRRDAPAEHPLSVALQSYEATLDAMMEVRRDAARALAQIGNQHPQVVIAQLPHLRPLARSHEDIAVALAGFRNDAGVLAVYKAMRELWHTRRGRVAEGPERDRCNAVLDRIAALRELVGPLPAPSPAEEALAEAQAELALHRGDLRAIQRMAEALATLGRPAESLAAWLDLLERMDNEHREAAVCLAAAAQAEAAGEHAQGLTLRHAASAALAAPVSDPEEVDRRLRSPAPYVRLRAMNMARSAPSPVVARALVALLALPPSGGPTWRALYRSALSHTIATFPLEGEVADALLSVDVPPENAEAWLRAALRVGDPRLSARVPPLLVPIRARAAELRTRSMGTDGLDAERLDALANDWDEELRYATV